MRRLFILTLALFLTAPAGFSAFQPTDGFSILSHEEEVLTEKFMNNVNDYDAQAAKLQEKMNKQQVKFEKKKNKFDNQIKAKQLERENFINVHQIRLEKNKQLLQELLDEK